MAGEDRRYEASILRGSKLYEVEATVDTVHAADG